MAGRALVVPFLALLGCAGPAGRMPAATLGDPRPPAPEPRPTDADPDPAAAALAEPPPGVEATVTVKAASGAVTFHAWLPRDLATARAALVVTNQSYASTLPWYQALALETGIAVIGTNASSTTTKKADYPRVIDDALAALAASTKHPELARAPLLATGFSSGASAAGWILESMPARMIAVALIGHHLEPMAPAARKVPYLLLVSEADPDAQNPVNFEGATTATLPHLRAEGAPFAVAVTWATGHGYAQSANFVVPFFQRAIARRLGGTALRDIDESDGWVGDPDELRGTFATIAPLADYAGDRSRAPWLFDGYLAAVWRAYNSTNAVVRIDGPPAIQVGAHPTNGAQYGGYPAGRVAVQVSLADGVNAAKVELFDGDRKLDERAAPPYAFAPALTRGLYTLDAIATGPDGRRHVSRPVTIFVR